MRVVSNLSPIILLAVICAVAIQIQASFFAHDGYLGLRLNVADFIFPFAGLGILASLVLKRSAWPAFGSRLITPLLASLSLWFGIALMHGLSIEPSSWALYNKGVGWVMLLAYFAVGAWLIRNGGLRVLQIFVETFVLAFIAVLLLFVVLMGLEDIGLKSVESWPPKRLSFFLGNRNIAGFFCVMVLLFLHALPEKTVTVKRSWFSALLVAYLFILPYIIMSNGSRVLLVFTTLSFIYMLVTASRHQWKRLVLPLLCGLCLIALPLVTHSAPQNWHKTSMKNYSRLSDIPLFEEVEAPKDLRGSSDAMRVYIAKDALQQWQNHPVIGIGIGRYIQHQQSEIGFLMNIIDSTPLWFLVEAGLIGFGLLAAFFTAVMLALFRRLQEVPEQLRPLYKAVILILLLFAAMSLVHELLYTRLIWLLVGAFVSVPLQTSAPYSASSK